MLSTEPVYYTYLIFCTRLVPLYVGKGDSRNGRAYAHFSGSGSHNKQLRGIWRKAKAAGLELPVVILAENLIEVDAFALEIFWIATLGRVDLGTGPLVNHTRGGDGVAGYKRTPAQCKAMSIARKGKSPPPHVGQAVSRALKGRPKTLAHNAAVSRAKKGVPAGPMPAHQSQAIGNALRGRKRTPKELDAMAAGRANMSEDAKRRQLAGLDVSRSRSLTAEHRINIGLAQTNMSPEKKASKSEKLSRALAGRKYSPERIEAKRKKVDAAEICRRYVEGESMPKLAAAFGVSEQVIDTRLIEGGIKKRSRGEAVRLRFAKKLETT